MNPIITKQRLQPCEPFTAILKPHAPPLSLTILQANIGHVAKFDQGSQNDQLRPSKQHQQHQQQQHTNKQTATNSPKHPRSVIKTKLPLRVSPKRATVEFPLPLASASAATSHWLRIPLSPPALIPSHQLLRHTNHHLRTRLRSLRTDIR